MNTIVILAYVSAALGGALAVAAAWRGQRLVARWAFVAGMLVLAGERICSAQSISAVTPEGALYWQGWKFVMSSFLPGTWLLFSVTYARGDFRMFLAKWRYALVGAFLLPTFLAVSARDHLMGAIRQTPAGDRLLFGLEPAGLALYALLLITSVVVLMNLERTYRASVGTMRWRIKFMLLGVGVIFVVRLYSASQALLFRGTIPALEILNSGALFLASLLIIRSLFRAGHFDLDVYPSQAVLQSSFTVLLAGIYLLVVGVFAKVVVYLGGDAAFGSKAFVVLVSLVFLAVVLQSDRARLHLRRFVSRNFQRPLYDYRTVWRKFTEATASRVEPTDLYRGYARLIADMFQALSVSLWLVDDRKEDLALAASTSLSEGQARKSGPQKSEVNEVIGYFREHPEPVDFEAIQTNWAASLRRWHPSEFPNGGNRIGLPLLGRGEVIGLLLLGDRVGGVAFSLQDFDMLKCIGDHVSASALNMQLSQKLLQAKELEAFQTMAAFFVHDLKNAANTLNLMLQNLPVHFDDPAFREDALRGVAKSVAHINHLVSRLSLLRSGLEIQPVESDLNEVVAKAVADLDQVPGTALSKELTPLPRLRIDPEQIGKVVTNLVLNATEAVAANGEVRIGTRSGNGWAVFTVKDNGCGMSAEFINGSLFRPFQTTKKNGLGIGMFQSRMIVEAHGGRMTVASEPGQGTTFQVFLPVPKETDGAPPR